MKYAFYKGRPTGLRAVFDWLIRTWMRGIYSHVEAIVGESGGLYTIASSVAGTGVRIAKNQSLPASDWDIFDGPGDEVTALKWFLQHQGKGYNYLGLFGFVLRPVEGEKGSYFCSESCCYAAGISEPWRFDPNALADLVKADQKEIA